MKIKYLILTQKIAAIVLFFTVLLYAVAYYLPWVEALLKGEYKTSYNELTNHGYHILKSEEGFIVSFICHSIRFFATSILLGLSIRKYYLLLKNVRKEIYFNESNYIYLIKIGKHILYLAFVLFVVDVISPRSYFISSPLLLFLGSVIYTMGMIFKEGYFQKQENDLTI